MDALLKESPSLKKHMKDPRDIQCTGKVLGVGPNGEMEELIIRGTHCAGKKLHKSLFDTSRKGFRSATILAKFASDYNQMSQLNHPNIANFLGLCFLENVQDSSKCLVLIREYVNDDLTHQLEANPCMPMSIKTSILLDVTKALEFLHTSKPLIVHRNLTSTNILITDSMHAKVTDMECSSFYDSIGLLEKKKLVFLPPEAKGVPPKYETASDMFSFGHIALHTAIHMFPGDLSDAPTEVDRRSKYIAHLKDPQGVDKILFELIINCFNDSPKKRPTANKAMKDLVQLQQKLECKEDRCHAYMKRMTMYEMAEMLSESHDETDHLRPQDANREGDVTQVKRRSMHFIISQIKDGQPSVLYICEDVKFTKRKKWMEYKFEICTTADSQKVLQYSRLNGSVVGKASLEEIVYVIAQRQINTGKEVYPFRVHFRSGLWMLAAHNEEERLTWMEAIFPGSTKNQWVDPQSQIDGLQNIPRSFTSPNLRTDLRTPAMSQLQAAVSKSKMPPPIPDRPAITDNAETPTNNSTLVQDKTNPDPAYIRYSEVNTPPQPKLDQPAFTDTAGKPTDNSVYLQLIPDSDPETVARTEAVSRYSIEQIHLMIEMFEGNVTTDMLVATGKRRSTDPTIYYTAQETVRNRSEKVSESSSKHESKGLYIQFSDLHISAESQKTFSPDESFSQSVKRSPHHHPKKMPVSPKKGLSRQNAVRHSQIEHDTSEKSLSKPQETKSCPDESDTHRLRTLLRQESSEDLLTGDSDHPDWSRAKLKDSEVEKKPVNRAPLSRQDTLLKTLSITASNLHGLIKIAIGHYGPVFKATLVDPDKSEEVTVAVKSFQEQLGEKGSCNFLQEIAVVAASKHPNIAQLYGVVLENNWLVMEYTSTGDLKQFLIRNRVSIKQLVQYMLDISMGMHYITARGLVHRNLALRNILVTDNTCKVADLGMRHLPTSLFPCTESNFDWVQEMSPSTDQRRWMAPENLTKGLFSEASDVWSFGVIQWEMFQPTRVPYSSLDSREFPNHIIKGHILEIPDICPEIVAKITRACWHWNATKRPSFMYIASLLMKRTLGE